MTYVACVITITIAAFTRSYVCSVLVSNRTGVPSPRINDVLTPPACQTLLTYTLILVGSPIRLQDPLCFCSACAAVKSDNIDHFFFDLALGTSRELLSEWVNVGVPPHSTPHSEWVKWELHHIILPLLYDRVSVGNHPHSTPDRVFPLVTR